VGYRREELTSRAFAADDASWVWGMPLPIRDRVGRLPDASAHAIPGIVMLRAST